ncbi:MULTISPECIES: TRAP transporter large permease subunit [Marivita]|uniref:TRAP transporter large permease subunit n=1 Tax=Marivita cryptomonadis TaxID=505252 RepID=A0A9Q2NU23_9RHOB|nr:TRAP transporter large permease subunit [Marivita cryptomonadis]MBM2332456.1 TRAP transporter large permease subunit [Marivita cryptomonadis]MBM2342039.1 TRAP transporter large permease subunit [Marivita cryptomonadis]MBM2346822.1 TRAP transporter large permease subunit [Marivita cryptomonadis]MBM2351499.1 TRAP transporter large permease subunit [Marivita cryptomonadis]
MSETVRAIEDPIETYEKILEHEDKDTQAVAVGIDKMVKGVGHVVMWANVLLIGAIVAQVLFRYLLNQNFPKLDEIQWHFYGLVTMVGISYALVTDSHVRVDILHLQLSRRAQRIIEVLGILTLVAPFLYLMVDQGWDYFYESWRVSERSSSPTGLPARWAFKAIIPISFVLLSFAALARLIHDVHALFVAGSEERQGKDLRLILWALVSFAVVAFALTFLVHTTEEKLVIAMFLTFIALLFTGFPVAWVLAGTGVLYCGIAYLFDNGMMNWTGLEETLIGLDYLSLGAVVNRVYATMSNAVLVALPMFIFMGLMLDESGVAEKLMTSMQRLFGRTRGGLAITVTMIGIILAASTGIIGASVVLLGVLALPSMVEQKYSPLLGTGVVAASGTLGILIPPSIMLVIMADQMALSVGDLFMAAMLPGMLIGFLYLTYIFGISYLKPSVAPAPEGAVRPDWAAVKDVLVAVLPTLGLILAVLGSIFAGITTPTEASGIGAIGATVLALGYRKLTLQKLINVLKSTFNTTAYIFAIFLGATVFSYVLRELGGDQLIEDMILGTGFGPNGTVIVILAIVFLLGFVLDWIEITLIVLPLMRPIINALGLDIPGYGVVDEAALVWFVILVAVTLQTSFLTPPVGFALFYLKGVCPPEIKLGHIYKGVVPFVLLQLTGLALVFFMPWLATWLPSVAY